MTSFVIFGGLCTTNPRGKFSVESVSDQLSQSILAHLGCCTLGQLALAALPSYFAAVADNMASEMVPIDGEEKKRVVSDSLLLQIVCRSFTAL